MLVGAYHNDDICIIIKFMRHHVYYEIFRERTPMEEKPTMVEM